MPLPHLPLPTRELADGFGALVDMLQSDPDLHKLNIDWRRPNDNTYDDAPAADRITIRLVPEIRSQERFALLGAGQASARVELALGFEITTPRYWEENANLWQQIEAVFYQPCSYQRGNAVKAALQAHAIGDIETRSPAIALEPSQTARGEMLVTMFVPA